MKIRISKKYFPWTLILLFLMTSQVYGHNSSGWIRAKSAGGDGTDWGNTIRSDKHGDLCVTGFFSSSVTFGKKTLNSSGGTDAFIAKFQNDGKLDWLLQIGGAEDDIGKDIAFDRKRNIYVTGWFNNSTTFYSTRGAAKTVTGSGETIFLAKYSRNGVLEWVRTGISSAPFPVINRGHGLAIEPGMNTVYLTGMSQMDTVFSSADNLDHVVPGAETWHVFLVRYDTDGNFIWGQRNEASPNSIPHRVAVDKNNNAYVTGWFEGAVTFYGNDGLNQTLTGLSGPVQEYPDYPDDAFIVKYDKEGNVKWVNQVGGYKAIGTDIAVSKDSKIAVTGFIGNIEGTPAQTETIATSQAGGANVNLGSGQLTNPYNADAFIATYNKDGVLLDTARIGGNRNDGGGGVAYGGRYLYMSGVFQGVLQAGEFFLTGQKENNLFVLKYSEHGIVLAKKADGAGNVQLEQNTRICALSENKIYLTGAYSDEAIFKNVQLRSAGAEDIFLAPARDMFPGSKEIVQPPSINSCDDGIEACNGNEQCISCLQDAECASGPNPVWTGTACVCTDDNPANCVYEFCCALGFDWDPASCTCLPES